MNESGLRPVDLTGPLLGLLAVGALALASGENAVTIVILGAAGAGGSLLLASWGGTRLPIFRAAPIVIAFVAAVPLLPSDPLADAVAGFAGLGVLLATTFHPERSARRLVSGLLLPALSVSIAWLISVTLPAAQQAVPVAGGLLLLALGFLLWSVVRSPVEPLPSPS